MECKLKKLCRSKLCKHIAWLLLIVFVFMFGKFWANLSGASYMSSDYDYDDYYGGDYEMMVMESSGGVVARDMKSAVPTLYNEYDEASYDEMEDETLVIKTGDLSLKVKNAPDVLASLTTIASAYDGFVQDSSTWVQSDETMAGYVTLRVGVEYFEQALEDIKALSTVVQSESLSGQDVTAEYVDMQAELTNLQAEEAQYLEILERAYTVEDLLSVSDYLSRVRGEIEWIEGQLQYLENRTSYSTITVNVYEEASIIAPTSDWQPFVLVKESFNQLVVLVQSAIGLVIWVVIVWVPVLVGLTAFYVAGRWVWRKVRKS
jgi:hypothetical protein